LLRTGREDILAVMPLRAAAVAAVLAALAASRGVDAQTPPPPPPPSVQEDHSERIARATVVLLIGDQPRARGVVLADDGRVVTSLAALGGERNVTIRFPNGRTQPGFVAASDSLWGIALVQARGGRWPIGLSFATSARGNTPARWMNGDDPRSIGGTLRRRRTYVGNNGELLRDAWELDPAPSDSSIGSGVANTAGDLVGVIVPPDPSVPSGGAPAPFGVPASAIQALVQGAGNTARPWVGFLARTARPGDTAALALGGLRVIDVTRGSPADRAGIRAGRQSDTIVGSGDREIHTVEDLGAVLEPLHPGDSLPLRVVHGGSNSPVDVTIQLAEFPPLTP
jgi:S1-C subfamily serine protease